jgi:hypothetical protein
VGRVAEFYALKAKLFISKPPASRHQLAGGVSFSEPGNAQIKNTLSSPVLDHKDSCASATLGIQ